MFFIIKHRWRFWEDIEVAQAAIDRHDDPKSISKLAKRLGLKESKVKMRMGDFTRLLQGRYPDWDYSKQEKEVFEWLMDKKRTVKISTI